jgi:transglutaminase-like putative cysteine protease
MSRISLRAILALVLFAGYASAQQPPYKLEITDVHKVNATITYEIKTKEFTAKKWMIFVHEPPDTPSQGNVTTKSVPAGEIRTEKGPLERKARYIEIIPEKPMSGRGVKLQVDIEATIRSRKLVRVAPDEKTPSVTPLTETERKYYLAPSIQVDFESKEFRAWLDAKKLHIGKDESPLDLAERILAVLRADVTYHSDPYEDKRASVACKSNKTDCVGMTVMFVGAMRASGIPARAIVGRTVSPRPTNGRAVTSSDHPHVRAEMYLPNIGWVPVDPSYANGNSKKPVKEFIGNDIGDLLVLHVDTDLKMPFPDRVRNARFLQLDAFYWAEGDGRFDATFAPAGWEMKSTPITKK